ncbi:MAG: YafY family protein [Tahibacter sp.]
MSHPAARVLAVLELLQANARLSGSELAQRLGVDARTLRRYIATLEDLGIPIIGERGRYGGYALVPGFKLPPLMFSDDEALALSLGLLAARSLGIADAAPAVASAQAKLERVMPPKLRRHARAIDETVSLDLRSAPASENNAALLQLSDAARAQQSVSFDYCAADGRSSARQFDAYGLALRGGRWYAVGYCHLRGGVRSFRLDRVLAVRALPRSFRRPEGFDAARHLSLSIASLPREFAVEVWIDSSLADAQALFPPDIGQFEAERSGTRLRAHTDHLDWFARQLARLPFAFEIRTPAALGDALRAHAQRLLQGAPRARTPRKARAAPG